MTNLPNYKLRRRYVLLILLLAAGGVSSEAAKTNKPLGTHPAGDGPWVVRVQTADRELIGALATWADVWAVYPKKGYVLLQVDRADYARLVAEGLHVSVDDRRTEQTRQVRSATRSQTSGITGFPCYRTVEETYANAQQMATDHPSLATWTDVGDSWEKTQNPGAGYDLMVLRLTQLSIPGPKPKLFLSCAMHGREYTTAELCTRYAELLVDGYGTDADATWILDHHEIHLLLVANPDGRKMAETGLLWRKNTDNDFCTDSNVRGVDLNRNFDFEWGCCGGSSALECDTTFRGPTSASEPEIQSVQSYVSSIFPDQRSPELGAPAPVDATGVALDIHASGQLVVWSWGFSTDPAPNGTQLQTLGRKLAYFNGHTPQPLVDLYVTDGSSPDFYYGELGVAGFLFELGTQFFQSCAYFESSILEQNLESLLYAAKVARTPYLTPGGPETLNPTLPPQPFAPGQAAALTATVDDTQFSIANGTEPSHDITAGEYYVDVPPWTAGASPSSMTASDGTFDSTVEAVEASVDTTGLSPGRHTLFVRGKDATEQWGAVSAVFLHVIDPATAPTIVGTVSDAYTSAPLVGQTVTLGGFEAVTDTNGEYSMQVPAGTYDITAHAAGYQSASVVDVTAAESQTVIQNFDLLPFTDALLDDVEAGNIGWSAQAPWAITDAQAFSPTHSWTDSPGSQYGSNVDAALTSPTLNLSGLSSVNLTFRQLYELEAGFDFARVDVSADGGQSWTEVAAWSGSSGGWTLASIALPTLDGAVAGRVRFRIDTDDLIQADGWYLDDIQVYGLSQPCTIDADCDDTLFCNGAESCVGGSCQPATDPCTVGSTCDESNDTCSAPCGDGTCEAGEDCTSCPADCPSFSVSAATCGNGLCEAGDGEDCVTCADDCDGRQNGQPSQRFCCGFGGVNPVGCSAPRCTTGGFQCTEETVGPPVNTCCGDLTCDDPEDSSSCPLDCGAAPACGDQTCDPGEDPCACAIDCGQPPATETACTDGLDDDCDQAVDCTDSDCGADPACQIDCSQYTTKPPCNADPACRWDNRAKACVPL